MSRPLVSHYEGLIDVGSQLLAEGGRTLASRDPLVEWLLLLVEEPLDDDQRLVVAVLKVAVEDDAGGGGGARAIRLRGTDAVDADAPNARGCTREREGRKRRKRLENFRVYYHDDDDDHHLLPDNCLPTNFQFRQSPPLVHLISLSLPSV